MQSINNNVQKKPGEKANPADKPSSEVPGVQMRKAASGIEGFDAQSAALTPPPEWAPVQGKGQPSGDVHAAAAHGIESGGGALPHLGSVQQAFGKHDVSAVQAHTGEAAAQANQAMGAEAYATGNHVAFGGAPDLHTVAHEAAHVVQQRSGVSLSGGVGQTGDAYEQHADQVADAVVQGKSAEPILDKMSGGGGGGGTQQKAIQQKSVGNGPELLAVQEKLNKLGFDCGKADGVSGPKTRASIKAFQASQGLVADGIIGDKTLGALDAAAGGAPAPAKTEGPPKGGPGAKEGSDGSTTTTTTLGPETKAGDKGAQGTPGAKGGGQTEGLEKKKEESKKHEPPSPEEVTKKNAEFSSEGSSALAAVKGAGGGRLGSGGDTVGGSVAGYPSWFGELQDWLVNSAEWTDTHETAQNVLYRYAMWKTECDLGYVPANIEFFFRYIGKSDGNNKSAKKAGKKGAEDLGGYGNAKNWCAQATSGAAEKALKERGLKFKGGVGDWIAHAGGKKQGGGAWCVGCNGQELTPGDSVSYVGKNHHPGSGGHRVTVLEDLGGGTFLHASGNAGGGGSGSVRLGTSKRSDVPKGWQPESKSLPTDDTVWVFSLQKTGEVFGELAKLDGVPATDPSCDKLLQELRLARI